jgi:uncharacterized SAM-binding protein YcdF (DUF218 family)
MGLARLSYRLIFTFAAFVLLVSACLALDVWRFGGYTAPVKADAALVLGAAVLEDRPSPVLAERLRHAQELYRTGDVGKIVVTGGRSPEDDLSEAAASRDWLVAEGVPASDIILEDQSRTTLENFSLAKPMLKQAGIKNVLIVSDPLHMRRAMLIAKRNGIAAASSPTPTTRYRSWDTTLPFLAREVWFMGRYLVTGL